MRCELGCDGLNMGGWLGARTEFFVDMDGLGRVGFRERQLWIPFLLLALVRYTFYLVRQQRDGTMVCSGLTRLIPQGLALACFVLLQ